MAATTLHITAGLPITKDGVSTPGAGETVAYITAGLPKVVETGEAPVTPTLVVHSTKRKSLVKPRVWWPGLDRQDSITDGLVGYWPMWEGAGGVVRDVSGHGNQGVITGATWGSDTLSFDGDDYISLGARPCAACYATNAITMAIAVRPNFTNVDHRTIGAFEAQADSRQAYLWMDTGGAGPSWAGGASIGGSSIYLGVDAVGVSTTRMQVVMVTWDGTTLAIWADGELRDSSTPAGTLDNDDVDYYIGKLNGTSPPLVGDMGWAGIWNRALVPSEIKALSDDPYRLITPRKNIFFAASAAAGGPETVPASLTDGAESTDTFTNIITTSSGVTEDSTSDDTVSTTIISPQSVSDTAESDDTFTASVSIVGAALEAATSSSVFTTTVTTQQSLVEGAVAGDTFVNTLAISTSIEEASTSDDTISSTLISNQDIDDSAESSDSFTTTVISQQGVSEGATSSDSFTAESGTFGSVIEAAVSTDNLTTLLIGRPNIADGVASGDTFSGALSTSSNVTEAATSSDSVVGVSILPTTVEESATSTDAFLANILIATSVTEASLAGDTYTADVISDAASISESATSNSVFSTQLTSSQVIAESVISTSTFVAGLISETVPDIPGAKWTLLSQTIIVTMLSQEDTFTLPVRPTNWELII